jgi:hypothetical protein
MTFEYMGQHFGWHFYVGERTGGHLFYGIASPPIDGKAYTTEENRTPTIKNVPGTRQLVGTCKAQAVYKAVDAIYHVLAERDWK